MIDYQAIWNEVTSAFRCELNSIHGPEHWHRVEAVGLKIAHLTGRVDRDVVRLFAVLHDSCRLSDNDDPEHGERAAEYAKGMHGRLFDISDTQFGQLYEACRTCTTKGSYRMTLPSAPASTRTEWIFGGSVSNRTQPSSAPQRCEGCYSRTPRVLSQVMFL